MNHPDRQSHWNDVYRTKDESAVSWFQESPTLSLELIHATGAARDAAIIDIGGGASRLVDALLAEGYTTLTVLDLSGEALARARARLQQALSSERAAAVRWLVADATSFEPEQSFEIWHDRAAFHFLTEAADRAAYLDRLHRALRPGGHAIIATFAPDGPERCSGLPVVRYDAETLSRMLGASYRLIESRTEAHRTPSGAIQHFQFSRFRRAR
jgi:SAM-dependent methyltransferase